MGEILVIQCSYNGFQLSVVKTKPKQSLWPIITDADILVNQSDLEAMAQENACEQVMIGFGFTSDWLRKWREMI